MRYAKIRSMDISNGEGIGVALFVQGCHFHCKNCFNQSTWDFEGGELWTPEVEDKFVELAGRDNIKRISILGGEPLASENVRKLFLLVKRLKEKYPDKKIWIHTGYELESIFSKTFEEFINGDQSMEYRQSIVGDYCDVLVDGRYVDELKDRKKKYAGSTNQRVIDVRKTMDSKNIVIYE